MTISALDFYCSDWLVLHPEGALFPHLTVSLSINAIIRTRLCFRFLLVGIVGTVSSIIVGVGVSIWFPSSILVVGIVLATIVVVSIVVIVGFLFLDTPWL